MSLEATGKLHEVFNEVQVSEKFRKREFVLEIPDGSYTQYVKFQLTQDKCDLLNNYKTGDELKVQFNLSGKPFTKNGETLYFTNLQAWRLEAVSNSPVTPQQKSQHTPVVDEVDNDLPF